MAMHRAVPLFLLCLAMASAACKSKARSKEAAIESDEASATAEPIREELNLSLIYDGKDLGFIPIHSISVGEHDFFATLIEKLGVGSVELSKIRSIEARGISRVLEIQPSLYPKSRVLLIVKTSSVGIALYQPSNKSAPPHVQRRLAVPHLKLDELSEIRLHSHGHNHSQKHKSNVESKNEAGAPIALLIDGSVRASLTPDDMLSIQATVSSGKKNSERSKKSMYSLRKLVGNYAELSSIAEVKLASDKSVKTLGGEALRNGDWKHLIKRNKKGEWLYRFYKGQSPKVQEELRGLVRIEATLSDS